MSNIINFQSKNDFNKYLKNNLIINQVGFGSEGTCYTKKNNKYCYKYIESPHKNYNPDEIILLKDTKAKKFLLPIDLYTTDNKLIGYKNLFINNNIFNLEKNMFICLKDINYKVLLEEYKNLIEDTQLISQDKIRLFDVTFNLLFNNRKLYVTDTLEYYKVNYNPMKENLECINDAIKKQIKLISDLEGNNIYTNYMEIDDSIELLTEYQKIYKR